VIVGIGIDAIREQVAVAVPGVRNPVGAAQALGVVAALRLHDLLEKILD